MSLQRSKESSDYASYRDRYAEWLERLGYAADADERTEGFEDDLQVDLAAERLGVCPPLGRTPAASAAPVIDLQDHQDDGLAAGTGQAA